jgi:biotin operon repressor
MKTIEILTEENILEIGRTYGRTKGATDLAKELGVSKQRVSQIVQYLRKGGVPIPNLKNRKYFGLIQQLKQELK